LQISSEARSFRHHGAGQKASEQEVNPQELGRQRRQKRDHQNGHENPVRARFILANSAERLQTAPHDGNHDRRKGDGTSDGQPDGNA